jgi:hypothetical protein
MTRILMMMIVFAFSLPAFADRDKGREGNDEGTMTLARTEANKRDLVGKERKRFLKECKKDRQREETRAQRGSARIPRTRSRDRAAGCAASAAQRLCRRSAPRDALASTPAPATPTTATAPLPQHRPRTRSPAAAKPAPEAHTARGSNERAQKCRNDPQYKARKPRLPASNS